MFYKAYFVKIMKYLLEMYPFLSMLKVQVLGRLQVSMPHPTMQLHSCFRCFSRLYDTPHSRSNFREKFILAHGFTGMVPCNGKGRATGGLVGSGSPSCLVMGEVADQKQSPPSSGLFMTELLSQRFHSLLKEYHLLQNKCSNT